MATNQTKRVLELLKRFNNGELISVDTLIQEAKTEKTRSLWFNDKKDKPMSEKSIRRDFDVIREYFPGSFELIRGAKGEKGFYKAITKELFDNFMDKDTLALMVQIFNIAKRNNVLKSININDTDKKILESKIKKSQECYEFITKPYETKKSDTVLLKEIERAIIGKRYTTIIQKEKDGVKAYDVKPYKIVFMHENFYLACENVSEEYPFTMFRLTNIQKIHLDTKTFKINPDIADFIKNLQTPLPKYTPQFRKHLIEVRVEVDSEKARFFKAKKFLPSQKLEEEKYDGTLILSFKVTHEMEMDELVKKWIPHMRVISPLSLKEKIEGDLREYLNIL